MKVLLYAPDLAGHPQVYCRVIARALLDAGHDVVLAIPSEPQDWGRTWPVLRPLADEQRVDCEDTRTLAGPAGGVLTAEQMVQLQSKRGIDSTLFIEGDKWADQFRRIAAGSAPRLRGRICAICDRAVEWYPGEDLYTGRREPILGPTVRRTLGRLRRTLLQRSASPRHYYEHVLLRRRTVDALIVKDERIAERFGPPVFWMPEIYRVFDTGPDERRGRDWDRFADPIRQFTGRAGSSNVLLYFGTGAWYKGYDSFLRLACMDETTFALHAGAPDRREPGKSYDLDVEAARHELLRQGRLFETGAFVESTDLIDMIFASIDRFVSTHRLALTSGTVLQALEMGKPVLAPDAGLLGGRIRNNNLGMTYRHMDVDHLRDQWIAFRSIPPNRFSRDIRAFMERFAYDKIALCFVNLIIGREP